MEKHNHKAIATAVFLHQVLGFVWYSHLMFGPEWLAGIGKSESQLDRANPLPFIASIFAAVLLCYLMSWLFQVLIVDDWQRGLSVGLLIGCGFIAPTLTMHYMFMGISYNAIMIDTIKEIIVCGMTGVILSTWRADASGELAEE
jgi:Protein of unknown function (DUF1761)